MSSGQALDAKRLNAFAMDPNNIVVIGHDTKDGPEHPLYDERIKMPLEESMILNIMAEGVHEAVLVRKNGDQAEVVAGRRRVLHAREANKRLKRAGSELLLVPVMVKRGTDGEMFGISISENEIRKDDVPSIKAEKLRKYLAFGHTEQDAAIRFGVSLQTIKNWGSMLDLDAKVLRAVDAGSIPASAAWKLSGLSRDEQKAELDKLLQNGHATVKSTQHAAKKAKARKKGHEEDEGYEPPGKRLVTKVLKINKKMNALNGDFLKGVMWVLGDIGPKSIGGLSDLIREAQGGKE